MKKFISIAALLFFSQHVFSQQTELKKLAEWMSGSFSSEMQHKSDTANFFDIRLEIIPIWKNKTNGYWFYVEQAMNGFLNKPYRQRVYHLKESGGKFESVVYTLKDPLRFAGNFKLVEDLSEDSLIEKKGCSVFLNQTNKDSFSGGTTGTGCPSDRKGAAFATSEVEISEGILKSLDRGFDVKGEQVWGSELGPYIFIKQRKY